MKIKTKIYQAPECPVLQVDITTPVLVGSGQSTAEGITINEEEFEW